MLLLTLLEIIPIIIIVNAAVAIPGAIWIKGRTEAILFPVILATLFLRSLLGYIIGGLDIVFTLTIGVVGLLTAAATNAIVLRIRDRNER